MEINYETEEWIRLSAIGPIGTAMWRAVVAIPLLAFAGLKSVKGAPKGLIYLCKKYVKNMSLLIK